MRQERQCSWQNRKIRFAVAKSGSWERASARDTRAWKGSPTTAVIYCGSNYRAQKGSPTTKLFLNRETDMRNPKFEAPNPKQYQNPNFKNGLIVLDLEPLNLFNISILGFRNSDKRGGGLRCPKSLAIFIDTLFETVDRALLHCRMFYHSIVDNVLKFAKLCAI